MTLREVFRLLVVIAPIAWGSGVWIDLAASEALDPSVSEHLDENYSGELAKWIAAQSDRVLWLLLAGAVALPLVMTAGLFFFKVWARVLWLMSFAASFVVAPLLGYSLSLSGWATLLWSIGDTASVVAITMAYVSDVKREFEGPRSAV